MSSKKATKKAASEKKFQRNVKKIQEQISVASPAAEVVDSLQPATTPTESAPWGQEQNMDITLTLSTKPRKSTRIVIYEGPINSVQFLRTAFAGEPPATLTLSGEGFAEPKAPKVKETKEERTARLKALPKPTLAERAAAAEKRAAALRAKLAAQPAL